MKKIERIIEKQKEFQRFVGFPIDSNLENDRNELSEKYVFKLIEEAIELRKEFPSVMNPWSKKQKEADFSRIKEEMSDIFLFFINLLITWKFSFEEIVDMIEKVQENNFMKIKEKKMKMLNERILNVPGYTSGIGGGNLNPKYVFIGQNPGSKIDHGYTVWNNDKDGSSRILLPILDTIGIRQESYFTNVVKSTTVGDNEPTEDLTNFWGPILHEELEILKLGNPDIQIIGMGQYVKTVNQEWKGISHPAYVLHGGITKEEYQKEIEHAIK